MMIVAFSLSKILRYECSILYRFSKRKYVFGDIRLCRQLAAERREDRGAGDKKLGAPSGVLFVCTCFRSLLNKLLNSYIIIIFFVK